MIFSPASYSVFLAFSLFSFLSHSVVFVVYLDIIIFPHLRILLYLIFILHERDFPWYFCSFNLFYEWGEIIKGQVKATTRRTKILFPHITFVAYNFDRMMLFIHNDPFQTGEKEVPHTGVHPASHTMGTRSFPGVKRPGRGVDHPLHLTQSLKKE